MSRILLVSPKFDSEFSRAQTTFGESVQDDMPDSLMVPLHLATVAALTPDGFDVDIWDEGARGEITDDTDLGRTYDLVGVTGYIAHLPRAIELAGIFRRRGITVVIGGPGVSGSPELCRGAFDVIFLGEAELTWPRFLSEWKRGTHRSEYRQVERPDLADSPAPRWDAIAADVARYRLAGVQTTRGCPFDCEFCDVIHLFGRRPRHKPVERVIQEIVQLHALGATRVFICDDDFIGDKKYAKEFLRALLPVNNAFDPPCSYSTQLTIDLAKDDELMELMADCNFTQVFIGIETPRAESLKETHKVQNLRSDLVEDCKRIQSFGLPVKAALIVGFDADDTNVFEEQLRFLEEANIAITSINTMKAYPGTPLWVRLQQEGRVVDVSDIYLDSPKVVSNILPKGMSRVELLEGYRELLQKSRAWDSFERRILAMLASVKREPKVAPLSPAVRQQRMQRLEKVKAVIDRLPPDARTAIANVIGTTFQQAPYMMERVSGLLMQQFMDAVLLPYHEEVIQQQIDQTLSGKLQLDVDPSAGVIPSSFKQRLKDIMPTLYERLTNEMTDRLGVPEAIVAVLKDFLIRWGKGFEAFEDFHYVYLQELCDRHIERFNSKAGDDKTPGHGNGTLTADHVVSKRFLTEVLVSVEQELRGVDRVESQQPLVELQVPATPGRGTDQPAR